MKKLLLVFGFLMMSFAVVYGQNTDPDPIPWSEHDDLKNYTVHFRAIDATCYNNGKVEFYIADASGNPIDDSTFNSLRLSDFYIVHKGVVLDTIPQRTPATYTFPKTYVSMETGTFDITLECLHQESDGNWVEVSDTARLTVDLDYTVPVISPLTVRSNDGVMLGNIPSLSCAPTGRVQINVTGGRYPYHFVVVNHFDATDTLRVVDFDTNQHFGTVDSLANYLNYYTFEDMPVGEWDFYLVDGCGYEMPRASQIVDVIAPPKLDSIGVYAFSGNGSDNNKLKLKVYLGNDMLYYLQTFTPHMQYRFLVPARPAGPGLSDADTVELAGESTLDNPWVDFPNATSDEVTVALNIPHAEKYCQLMDRDLILQVKLEQGTVCEPYIMYDTFHYHKPKQFIQENGWEELSRTENGDCGGVSIVRYQDHFSIRYSTYDPNYVSPHDDDSIKRYHFTYPLVWLYTNELGDAVIKRDTIYSNIAEKSYINLSDFNVDAPPFDTTINMHLFDANGCELYRNSRTIKVTTSTQGNATQWKTSQQSTRCCKEGTAPRTINLYEEFGSETYTYDGLTVRLFDSPNNTYNFTATYHASTHQWDIERAMELSNLATISGAPDGKSITMTDQCLPSGTYRFEVSNIPCITGAVTRSAYLQGYNSARVVEEPAFDIVNNCSNKFIKFTAGHIVRDYVYRPNGNNSQVSTTTVDMVTQFRLVDGPVGGYDRNDKTVYHVGDSILISMPTDSTHPYIIETTVEDKDNTLCEKFVRYDTIYYNGSTVMFDFALAFLCKVGDTIGTGYVRAWNGNPDYHYQLYDEPDLGGNLVGDTTLGPNAVAVFQNRLMGTDRQLSCRVEDNCGAAFKLNFSPQTMSEIQKTWFDGGLSYVTTCEGSTIQVHVLRVGDIFQYAWFKNDDTEPFTTSSEPRLFIPRGTDTAVYHVKIFQTGCNEMIEDSVTIYPKKSPYVDISSVDSVCPGQDVEVSFTPHAFWGDSVSFTIVFETRDDKDIRSYRVPSGYVVTDTFTANSEAKVYPYIVEDEECGYPVADPGDTIYIHISKKIINPCQIITTNDTVCYGDDAVLSAYCTENAPLVIRWYNDFEMKDLIDTFKVVTTGDVSYQSLYELRERTVRYVSVFKEGWCPSVNNNPNNVVNMTPDAETQMRCTDSYLFFDDGGPDGDYFAGQDAPHIQQVFVNTESDKPLTIHFDSLNLSSTSHLFLFSSSQPLTSHQFYELNCYSSVPDIIVSPNDTLMVYFVPGDIPSWGWRATVQPSPGIAIADVMMPVVNHYYDQVCQRGDSLYDNQEIISLNIVDPDSLRIARTHAGTYEFSRTDTTVRGCDSTTTLTFKVSSPPMKEILAVTTSEIGYLWNGTRYYEAGVYAENIPDTAHGGCDYLDVLNLIVIEVTNDDGDVCYGDSTVIGVSLVTNDSVRPKSSLIEERHSVGDVLCRKGSQYQVMRPEKYVTSGSDSGWIAYGVVVVVDPNDNSHGKAIALVDAYKETAIWAKDNYKTLVHAADMKTNYLAQREDMDGYANTDHIRLSASDIPGTTDMFKEAAPAAYYCYYYDPEILGTGGSHSKWYMPSCGEWYICFAYRAEINHTLRMLEDFGAAPFTEIGSDDKEVHYWTSTEVSNNNAVCVNTKGQIIQHHEKSRTKYPYRVRAMFAY